MIERSNLQTIERLREVEVCKLPMVAEPTRKALATRRAAASGAVAGPGGDRFDRSAEIHRGVMPPTRTAELIEADRRNVWHPFTQQQGWCGESEPPLVIEHAESTNLFDPDGNAYIDGVSSLWCNVAGHRHPAIDEAIRSQLERVAHSTMLGLSHPPAISSPRA